jgi:hypothetical protein
VTSTERTAPPARSDRPGPGRPREGPRLHTLLAGALVAWVVLVTAVHIQLNRRPLAHGAPGTPAARSLEVGGLPVT